MKSVNQGRNKEIYGIPGSPGRINGIAYVAKNLNHANKIKRSDILVTTAISPEWLEIFTQCSAVITDIGGKTSHAAVLCREIGIPAVVGTKIATESIKSGDRVIVDGSKGVVKILN